MKHKKEKEYIKKFPIKDTYIGSTPKEWLIYTALSLGIIQSLQLVTGHKIHNISTIMICILCLELVKIFMIVISPYRGREVVFPKLFKEIKRYPKFRQDDNVIDH